LVKSGQTSEDLIYQKIVGLKEDLSGPQNIPSILENNNDNDDSANSISEEESNDSDEEKSKFTNSARPKNENADSKRVRF